MTGRTATLERARRADAVATTLGLTGLTTVWGRPLGDALLLLVRVDPVAVAERGGGRWAVAGRCAADAHRMELSGVPTALELVGAVAFRSTAESALLAVGPFASVCTRTVVLPAHVAERPALATEAAVTGVGVLAETGDGRLRVVCAAQEGPIVGSRRGLVHRMIEESVYARLLVPSRAAA